VVNRIRDAVSLLTRVAIVATTVEPLSRPSTCVEKLNRAVSRTTIRLPSIALTMCQGTRGELGLDSTLDQVSVIEVPDSGDRLSTGRALDPSAFWP
jgi:hypothetical protein